MGLNSQPRSKFSLILGAFSGGIDADRLLRPLTHRLIETRGPRLNIWQNFAENSTLPRYLRVVLKT
jgi:hypothetical protein